jgi:hypothetical protein
MKMKVTRLQIQTSHTDFLTVLQWKLRIIRVIFREATISTSVSLVTLNKALFAITKNNVLKFWVQLKSLYFLFPDIFVRETYLHEHYWYNPQVNKNIWNNQK